MRFTEFTKQDNIINPAIPNILDPNRVAKLAIQGKERFELLTKINTLAEQLASDGATTKDPFEIDIFWERFLILRKKADSSYESILRLQKVSRNHTIKI